jgi:hypothetical protein
MQLLNAVMRTIADRPANRDRPGRVRTPLGPGTQGAAEHPGLAVGLQLSAIGGGGKITLDLSGRRFCQAGLSERDGSRIRARIDKTI